MPSLIDTLLGKKNNEPCVAVDIGTSSIKVLVLDTQGERPVVRYAGCAPTPANVIQNNVVTKPDQIGTVLRKILEANDITASRASLAIPGPAVFTKKITLAYTDLQSLDTNIKFEAGNYIPHNIGAVHLDYQVLGVNGTSTMDVLLVAVKNEVLNSYISAVEAAGLEPVVADVDYFAVENMFELNYPEELNKTVALVNVGARYSSVSILQDGVSVFNGDVGVGGRLYTDALTEATGMTPADAEKVKIGLEVEGYDKNLVLETLDRTTEHIAGELQRQIGFFWNAAATDRAIEAMYLAGGAARAPGLVEALGVRSGIPCSLIEPFRCVSWSENFDEEYINEVMPSMGVGVGLALRRTGDKQHAH